MDYDYRQDTDIDVPVKKGPSGVSVASLICGILGFVILTTYAGYGVSIAAIICGIIGIAKSGSQNRPKGLAIAGLILGCIALVFGCVLDCILGILTFGLTLLF